MKKSKSNITLKLTKEQKIKVRQLLEYMATYTRICLSIEEGEYKYTNTDLDFHSVHIHKTKKELGLE